MIPKAKYKLGELIQFDNRLYIIEDYKEYRIEVLYSLVPAIIDSKNKPTYTNELKLSYPNEHIKSWCEKLRQQAQLQYPELPIVNPHYKEEHLPLSSTS